MNQVIFQNPKKLAAADIYRQIFFGLSIIILGELLSPFRIHGQSFSWKSLSSIIFTGALLVMWIINALCETTLMSVEILPEQGKVRFILDRQLRNTMDFQLSSLYLQVKNAPDRFLPGKKLLTIKDSQNELKISSRQKGLSEDVF